MTEHLFFPFLLFFQFLRQSRQLVLHGIGLRVSDAKPTLERVFHSAWVQHYLSFQLLKFKFFIFYLACELFNFNLRRLAVVFVVCLHRVLIWGELEELSVVVCERTLHLVELFAKHLVLLVYFEEVLDCFVVARTGFTLRFREVGKVIGFGEGAWSVHLDVRLEPREGLEHLIHLWFV